MKRADPAPASPAVASTGVVLGSSAQRSGSSTNRESLPRQSTFESASQIAAAPQSATAAGVVPAVLGLSKVGSRFNPLVGHPLVNDMIPELKQK